LSFTTENEGQKESHKAVEVRIGKKEQRDKPAAQHDAGDLAVLRG